MNTIVVTGIREEPFGSGNYPVGTMAAFGRTLHTSCKIINRFARNLSVVYSENSDGSPGRPYQPMQFPKGTWPVGIPIPSGDPFLAPVFIRTGAHQQVPIWNIADYHYVSPAGEYIEDYGYGIHFDVLYETTDGCLHLYSADDATWLAQQIVDAQKAGEAVQITVA